MGKRGILNANFIKDYKAIVDCLEDNIAIFSIPDGKLVYYNKPARNFFGYSIKEAQKKYFYDFVHKDYIKLVKKLFKERLKGNKSSMRYMVKVLTKKRGYVFAEISSHAYLVNNKIMGVEIVFRDISKRVYLSEQLIEQKNIYKIFFNTINLPFLVFNKDLLLLKCNTKAYKFFNINKGLILPSKLKIKELISKGSFKNLQKLLNKARRRKNFNTILEITPFAKPVEICDVTINLLPGTGTYIASFHKITEEVHLQNLLKQSEFKYQFLTENSNDIILLLNAKKTIVHVNKQIKRYLGISPKELLGKNFLHLIEKQSKRKVKALFEIKDFKKNRELTIKLRTQSGLIKYFNLLINPIISKEGPIQFHITLRDVTEHIRDEKEKKLIHKLSQKIFLADDFNSILKLISSTLIELNNSIVLIEKIDCKNSINKFIEINYDNLDNLYDLHKGFINESTFNEYLKNYLNDLVSKDHNKYFLKTMLKICKQNRNKNKKKFKPPEVIFNIDSKTFLKFEPKHQTFFKIENVQNFYSILIRNKDDKVIAQLSLLRRGDKPDFSSNEIQMFRIICDTIGIAIERDEVMKKISFSEKKFHSVFSKANNMILITKPNGEIININRKAINELGMGNVNLCEANFFTFFSKKQLIEIREISNDFTKPINKLEITLKTLGNNDIITLFNSVPIDLDGSKILIFILRNVTKERKKDQDILSYAMELRNKNLELIALDKVKDDFLANFSHEFRTPLSSILGYMTFISDKKLGDINENQKKALDVCIRNLVRLNKMLDKLLDLSRIKGDYSYAFEKIDLFQVLKENLDFIRPEAEKNKVILTHKIPKGPFFTLGDKNSLTQVFINLLSNAIKFSQIKGKVSINVKKLKEKVHVSIKDNGIGIPADMLDFIFHRFFQVKGSHSKKTGGLGIGLSIVKDILLKHNIKIKVKSKAKEGTEFILTFPQYETRVIKSNEKAALNFSPQQKKKLHGKSILIVDIKKETELFLKKLFKDIKIKLYFSKNGKDTFDLLKKEKIDLMFIDFILEDCNAIELLQAVNKNKSIKNTSIYVFSPINIPNIQQEALKLGAKAVLQKPVSMKHLMDILKTKFNL